GERAQLAPGGILHVDAGLAPLLLAKVLDLAGIEHPPAALRRRRRLQVARELGHLFLELRERAEGVDLEHRHEAAVVVPPGWLDAEAEAGKAPSTDSPSR